MKVFSLKLIIKYNAIVEHEIFYEEVILMLSANSVEEAYEKAEEYGNDYIDQEHKSYLGHSIVESFYGVVDCYIVYEPIPAVDIENDIVEVYSHFYRKDRKFTEKEYEDILAQNCSREELKPLRYYNDLD